MSVLVPTPLKVVIKDFSLFILAEDEFDSNTGEFPGVYACKTSDEPSLSGKPSILPPYYLVAKPGFTLKGMSTALVI